MTRTELKALPLKDQIMFRASGSLGYPEPSTNAERAALNELLAEGHVVSAGRPQNSMTTRYKVAA